jgi:GNAT superfamily N-acetyltransferase
VNRHVFSATAGFTVPAAWLAARHGLAGHEPEPTEPPRETLVAVAGEGVVGAIQIVRHVDTEMAEPDLRGRSELAWLVAWPRAGEAARALLRDALDRFPADEPPAVLAAVNGLAPGARGASHAWPHLLAVLAEAGLAPSLRELLYAGPVPGTRAMPIPLSGLEVERQMVDRGVAFQAVLDGEPVATFTVDLPEPSVLPGLGRWARVTGMHVDLAHQRRGIGARLVRYASSWLRLAGRDRLFAVVADDERRLGAFWAALGLAPLSRIGRGYRAE